MELRVLKYFLTIANEQNISKAAEVLNITQPTLSRQIQDLEWELGKKLFERTNKKTVLTDDGLKLKKRAQEIVDMVELTRTEFKSKDNDLYGTVRVGAGETDAMQLLCSAMKNLKEKNPNVRFSIFSGIADDVLEKLNHGLLDFALLIEPVEKDDLNFIPLPVTDTIGLLVLKDSELARKKNITATDLKNTPLITGSRSVGFESFSMWLGYDSKELNIVGFFNLINNAALMVKSGLGAALSLKNLVNTNEGSPFAFVPLEPQILVPMILAWKKSAYLSDTQKAFLEEAQKCFDKVQD